MNTDIAPRPEGGGGQRRRKWTVRRIIGIPAATLTAGIVVAVNVPTIGGAIENWYHHYQITRPAYEAKYGRWVKLNIPSKFRVNGIHSTLLYNGDVLIMAGSGNNQAFFNARSFKTLLLNPVTMHEQLIPTPWDPFCAGHIELPDGNILIAGGTARYENLRPTHAAGSMTVVNKDTAQPWTLPKGTIFTAPDGTQFASATPVTVPRATEGPPGITGLPTVLPREQDVWVDAVKKGRGSLIGKSERYRVQGLLGSNDRLLYGLGTPMTLQKQDFHGTKDAYIFNVRHSRFVKVNSMNYARWYPTLAEMGNGMVMAMSGLDGQGQVTMNSEMFNPRTGTWAQGPVRGFPTYPATFLTENGQLFFTGSNAGYGPSTPTWRTPGFWNVKTNTFRRVTGIPDPKNLETSASVLLPPAQNQKIMVLGGGGVGQSDTSTARTALIDIAAPDPRWIRGPDLARPTRYPITALLPNDKVLVTGGSRYYRGMHGSDNRDTRIYNVATNSFSRAADSITGRDYHSGGILLPNGSVLTLGGNSLFGNKQDTAPQTFNQEIDVYFPPYMFQGTRPRIEEAPTVMEPGHRYIISVSDPSKIRYLRLMRPDNPTHVTDVNARSIAVPFRRVGGNDLDVTIPSNTNLMPPSYYMLFAVNAKGIPSTAFWVRVGRLHG
jgi:radical copper oxidase GlxA-like protein/galactose oxidase-like protein